MRRSDREINDVAILEEIITGSSVCRMGLCDEGRPYVVPMNFGYRDGKIYMHSALEGRKLDIIRKNPDVCLVFETDLEMVHAAEACSFSMKYRSVIARGRHPSRGSGRQGIWSEYHNGTLRGKGVRLPCQGP